MSEAENGLWRAPAWLDDTRLAWGFVGVGAVIALAALVEALTLPPVAAEADPAAHAASLRTLLLFVYGLVGLVGLAQAGAAVGTVYGVPRARRVLVAITGGEFVLLLPIPVLLLAGLIVEAGAGRVSTLDLLGTVAGVLGTAAVLKLLGWSVLRLGGGPVQATEADTDTVAARSAAPRAGSKGGGEQRRSEARGDTAGAHGRHRGTETPARGRDAGHSDERDTRSGTGARKGSGAPGQEPGPRPGDPPGEGDNAEPHLDLPDEDPDSGKGR